MDTPNGVPGSIGQAGNTDKTDDSDRKKRQESRIARIARMKTIKTKKGKIKPQDEHPTVYVIAGPNGAGKTTFATEFLPDFVHCREFLNADLIAAGLSPFAPETQNVRAGRLLLTRTRELIKNKENFSFETTLAGRGYVRLFKTLRADEYQIVLFFLWLPNPDVAVSRVRARVRQGGHYVPEPIVRRRYESGLLNALSLYKPLAHIFRVYDASHLPPKIVAHEVNGKIEVFDIPVFERIMKNIRT